MHIKYGLTFSYGFNSVCKSQFNKANEGKKPLKEKGIMAYTHTTTQSWLGSVFCHRIMGKSFRLAVESEETERMEIKPKRNICEYEGWEKQCGARIEWNANKNIAENGGPKL